MSVQQWFNEVEAVVPILQEFVAGVEDHPDVMGYSHPDVLELHITAMWQAAELLARAHSLLVPLYQLELMKRMALDIPDPQPVQPKTPKKGKLYGPNGKPL